MDGLWGDVCVWAFSMLCLRVYLFLSLLLWWLLLLLLLVWASVAWVGPCVCGGGGGRNLENWNFSHDKSISQFISTGYR